MGTAFYPGSFDPMTNGHLDVVLQALNIADRLVIGIGVNAGKKPLFTFEQRAGFLKKAIAQHLPERNQDVRVEAFEGLAIDAARKSGATMIIRGLRDSTDFAYEMQMAGMNQTMASDIQTVFLPAMALSRPISATLVRQVAAMGGDVNRFVPPFVATALSEKFSR
ncbi:pantetheine-phosphate adenylyltransferase [Martelella mediterranea]|uniref:Phosphopantetheine adenylyltransferase n=1 Tax=Martelella mediterranea TaxID=293089 RepID=A0A4R3NTQ1_9HYPH|nr:pantetheine-phosphate adenylyltransferase [Martelella mediterranea]TCT39316.1 phosphopantetheine adenylyltransferase [Martelella mediterranea]